MTNHPLRATAAILCAALALAGCSSEKDPASGGQMVKAAASAVLSGRKAGEAGPGSIWRPSGNSKVSAPGLRSGPLATPTSTTPSTLASSSTARACATCPAPPSISSTSGTTASAAASATGRKRRCKA